MRGCSPPSSVARSALKTGANESGVKWGEGGMRIELTDSLLLPARRATRRLMRGTGVRHDDDPDFARSGILSGMFYGRPSSPTLLPSEQGEGSCSVPPLPSGTGEARRRVRASVGVRDSVLL